MGCGVSNCEAGPRFSRCACGNLPRITATRGQTFGHIHGSLLAFHTSARARSGHARSAVTLQLGSAFSRSPRVQYVGVEDDVLTDARPPTVPHSFVQLESLTDPRPASTAGLFRSRSTSDQPMARDCSLSRVGRARRSLRRRLTARCPFSWRRSRLRRSSRTWTD
jgi:hypothetical protein